MSAASGSNGTGQAGRGRRSKKFLSPSAKYEIWLQLVRGEATINQAASTAGVDRSTVLRIRTVAKEAAMAGTGGLETRGRQVGSGCGAGSGERGDRPVG